MEMSTSDIVEVHLLELPDVVQDTIPTCKSTERDRAYVLRPADVCEIVDDASSAAESSEQLQMLMTSSSQSVAAEVEPTAPSIPANSTSPGNADPSLPGLLLPLATKAAILADVRSGKLSKAEIVYKYHIRWAILYDVIRNASEIDAEQRRLGLSPETPDSPPGAERGGLKRRPSTSVAKEGQQKAPGVFMSEDLYFNPPKKLNYMPGHSFKRVKLLVDDLPAANTEGGSSSISVAAAMTTMTEAEIAGCGVSTKTSRPVPPDVRAASTQTLPSLGKGSLMTFMSTTNGTVAMTQVSHRRQADKGSGTSTQDSGTQPSVVNPEGDSRMVRSLEHLRPRRKAKIRKVSGARRSNAVPSPQLPLATEPADSLTSAQSSGFALTLVKQEVSSDIEAEDIEYDPVVVPKQEPLSPQEEDCDDSVRKCEVDDERCGDIIVKCEVDADGGDEQTFQPPLPRSVNQWDDVTVKTEPPSP
ncbi:hypothetical protein HPB51_023980 [Rhipicephalus microplus]|uniref:Uncharacterized protein n=1 Tax=Rhipicephalus microplus TaxID=6941 RepID=A0A9J6ECH6_RHIMP|nr:hypothetical protein HPB51_023980 [Rhipicephalus microplus]